MKKIIRVLHLASFEGNIGDNANHNGSRRLWERRFPHCRFIFDQLEIREFYWKMRSYDKEFIDLVNEHDMLMVGGGNYFELWVESSPTGTSVAIPLNVLEQIKKPILFYALGMDRHMGAPQQCVDRFKAFLDHCIGRGDCLISVRNDGSLRTAELLLGTPYTNHIHLMPDGGFFVGVRSHFHPELTHGARTIGINLAGDMLDFRYGHGSHGGMEQFLREFSDVLQCHMDKSPDLHAVFYPHIPKDLAIIGEFIARFPDPYLRRRVTVAPYLHGFSAEEYIFDSYRNCIVNIGNRFHTNVCSIGLLTPSIGIANHRQIEELYRELGIPDRCLPLSDPAFPERFNNLLSCTLHDPQRVRQEYIEVMDRVQQQAETFLDRLESWFEAIV